MRQIPPQASQHCLVSLPVIHCKHFDRCHIFYVCVYLNCVWRSSSPTVSQNVKKNIKKKGRTMLIFIASSFPKTCVIKKRLKEGRHSSVVDLRPSRNVCRAMCTVSEGMRRQEASSGVRPTSVWKTERGKLGSALEQQCCHSLILCS